MPLITHAATDVTAAFTDANFLDVVRSALRKPPGAAITAEECATIRSLNASYADIESLAGIEHLTSLSVFDCSGNQLAVLDFSTNPTLTRVGCGANPLVSLNVGQNPNLVQLNSPNTLLTTLDVSRNANLEILDIANNPQLGSVDVTRNPKLTDLNVTDCGLTSLDISRNPALVYLFCGYNKLQDLDITNHVWLQMVDCSDNQLTSLSLSGCRDLMALSCDGNRLTGLDVTQVRGLVVLTCNDNQISSLNLRLNLLLTDLRCNNNFLSSLDVASNLYLENMECTDNAITFLDLNKNAELVTLDCAGNRISDLDLSDNTMLYALGLAANRLSALDIRGLTRLRILDVSNNKFPSRQAITGLANANLYTFIYDPQTPDGIDITSAFTDPNLLAALRKALNLGSRDPIMLEEALLITELDLDSSGIGALHGLEYFSNLTKLSLMENALTELDATCFPKLAELDCSNNQLATLDVSGCADLEKLWCSNNQLERLDLSQSIKLNTLNCYENRLVTLDLSRNPAMRQLICSYNLLSALDLSRNPAVNFLDVRMNFLPDENAVLLAAGRPDTFLFSPQRNLDADMSEFFTDHAFLAALLEHLEKNEGDPISALELQSIIDLDISNRGIKSLAGLSFLTNLQTLNCSGNKLTGFDVYNNTALHTLDATLNWMSSPDDVYNLNPGVTTIFLFSPQKFSGENVTAKFADPAFLAALREALGKEPDGPIGSEDCAQRQTLDLQNRGIKNTAGIEYFTGLKTLNLSGNELSQLSLAQNTQITQLNVSGNHLQTLNLAPNRQLQSVNVSRNFMENQSALRFSSPAPQNVTFNPQHSYVEIPPTCTTGGYGTWTCDHNPPHTLQVNQVRALGHDYRRIVVQPTLASEGYTQCTCSRCGDSYTEDMKPRVTFNYNNTLTLQYHGNTTLFSDADRLAPELTWKSSNEKVLKINDNGLITFPRLARGTTTITGSAGGADYIKVDVTVKIAWWQWLIIVLLFGWIWY
jgi:hypothetical protein